MEMQLFKDIAGKGASEVNSKQRCFYKMFEFKHGALFLLHPQDEKDIYSGRFMMKMLDRTSNTVIQE